MTIYFSLYFALNNQFIIYQFEFIIIACDTSWKFYVNK